MPNAEVIDGLLKSAPVASAIFALEQTRIFERAWIYAGHESEIARPGDYVLLPTILRVEWNTASGARQFELVTLCTESSPAQIRAGLPELKHVLCVDGAAPDCRDLWPALADQPAAFTAVDTSADDPALIIYTSGTTGQPKGALHAHRVLLGHLPGVEMSHDLLPQPGDRIWTPADWAWIGGLLDVLLPALHHGVPVMARRFEKFSGEAAFQLIEDFGIRNAFLPPTALKMMRAVPEPEKRWRLAMRSIASGGETLGAELIEWGRRVFGLTINEFYGQTECNMIVSSCAQLMPARPGIMGRAVPGHRLAIVDDAGALAPEGKLGNIAVHRPDPVMFLEYWGKPDATREKFIGDWMTTGDQGTTDGDGRDHTGHRPPALGFPRAAPFPARRPTPSWTCSSSSTSGSAIWWPSWSCRSPSSRSGAPRMRASSPPGPTRWRSCCSTSRCCSG